MLQWLIVVSALMLLVICRVIWELRHFECVEYNVDSPKISGESQKIAMIADLHSCEFGEDNKILVEAIRKRHPNAIFIAGDMLVGKKSENGRSALTFLEQIQKEYPIYYGNGNHESRMKEDVGFYGNIYARYRKRLDLYHIKILENRSCDYENPNNIEVYGLEIDGEYYNKGAKISLPDQYLESVLGKPDPDKYNILIAHNPMYFEDYAKWGADLVLSGHNHGGIVGTPFKRGLISTQFTFFEKYYKGVFEEGNCKMVVTTGLGTHTIPFRLFNKQQLVFINLTTSDQKN